MKLIKSKKGQGTNYVAVTATLLIFAFISMVTYIIYFQFTQGLTDAGFYTGQAAQTGNDFLNAFLAADYLIIFLAIGLIIVLGITMFRIASAPIFFIVTLIMGIFWAFISYVFSFIFSTMITIDPISTVVHLFPRTVLLATNLHWVGLICIIVGSLTLYAKRSRGQFQTQT